MFMILNNFKGFEDFSLFIKQYYLIVQIAEKIWKVKTQGLKKTKEYYP